MGKFLFLELDSAGKQSIVMKQKPGSALYVPNPQDFHSNFWKSNRLWVHGGMLMEPLGDAAPDTWVLTMPSFMFVSLP